MNGSEGTVLFVEFKECFYLYATDKLFVTHADQLSRIMRSVGFSPTEREIGHYFETYKKGGIFILYVMTTFFVIFFLNRISVANIMTFMNKFC